ncbi:MAG: YceH family protein [Candidatus Solibacter usitatus]|nr:YceH family protein [Candidatus Solibacter usitatus]
MSLDLDPIEARVLGCLAEKDMATPEYYPLSLNALVNACNQKSNRDPVVAYDDATVREALNSLRDQGLAVFISEAGSRVEKYRHRLSERFNFTRGELALLSVLLLRGPQTPGELRQRTERLHDFGDLDTLHYSLDRLAAREPDPLVKQLDRVPGMKESRWAHLLSGEPRLSAGGTVATVHTSALHERVEQLEREVAALRQDLSELRDKLSPLLG